MVVLILLVSLLFSTSSCNEPSSHANCAGNDWQLKHFSTSTDTATSPTAKCYKVKTVPSGPTNVPLLQFVHASKNWYHAKDYCERHGGRLVKVEGEEEAQFIAGMSTLYDGKLENCHENPPFLRFTYTLRTLPHSDFISSMFFLLDFRYILAGT